MLREYLDLPRAVHILCLGSFINRAGTFVIPFLTIYLRDQLGLGIEFATTAMGLCGVGAILGALIGGHLTDHVGRRAVMLAALFVGPLFLIVLAFLTTGPAILACLLCFTLVSDMYRPAASAMIADLVEPLRRPQAFGLMYVSINLGFAFGPAIGGLIADYSFRLVFFGDAATTFVYAMIVLLLIRETRAALPGSGGATDGESGAGRTAPAEPGFVEALRTILRDRVFMRLCFGSLLIALVYMQAMSTFPLFLQGVGIGPAVYGRIIATNGLLIVLLQIPVAALVARWDRGWALVLAAVLTAIGFGLHGAASTPWQFVLAVAVWTVGELMQVPLLSPIVAELAPAALRGRYMGMLSMSFSGANMIGAPLGGLVLTRLGGYFLWPICTALGLLAAIVYLTIRRRVSGFAAR
ncbi:MAG: MFS transporter [Phycisphaerae bacterium]|jgi:MFS family permease